MVEEIHMYLTAILAFFLTLLSGVTGWLILTVIANQARIAVLENTIGSVDRQLTEINRKFDNMDREMNEGLGKIHERINTLWRDGRGGYGGHNKEGHEG